MHRLPVGYACGMSKAFTRETEIEDDGDGDEQARLPELAGGGKNYITPGGYARLKSELLQLIDEERPKVVDVVHWAAGNGDRSENGDYLYGRKRMREIDRELAHLARRMKAAKVVDPARQPDRDRIWFGATIEIADEDDDRRTLTLVGDDEQDPSADRIGWSAPIARALRGAAVGDLRTVRLPAGEKEWEVLAIAYPPAS